MRIRLAPHFVFTILAISIVTVAGQGTWPQLLAQTNYESRQGSSRPAQGAGKTLQASPEQIRAKFETLIRQQAWNSPRVTNPNSPGANGSIVAVLRRQQQAAEAEKAQILAAATSRKSQQQGAQSRPAGPNAPLTPGRTVSSASNSTVKNMPASNPSEMKNMEFPGSTAICPPGLQPVLRTVDGQKSGVIFTPEITYTKMAPTNPFASFYTIEGCHFGDIPGHVALTGPFSKGKIDLAVDTWTDSGIVVHVPADVSGEFDQDNVTLALTINGMGLQAPGFKFYAARDEVLLSFVPAKEASLAGPQLRSNFPFFQSPGFGTFDVQRNADSTFGPGTDYYSFDALQPGFVPLAFQASQYAPLTAEQCNYMVNREGMQISFDGQWNARWEGNRLRVDWPVAHCYAAGYNEWAAWYGAKIWVSGPRGIDPWLPSIRLAPAPVRVQNPH